MYRIEMESAWKIRFFNDLSRETNIWTLWQNVFWWSAAKILCKLRVQEGQTKGWTNRTPVRYGHFHLCRILCCITSAVLFWQDFQSMNNGGGGGQGMMPQHPVPQGHLQQQLQVLTINVLTIIQYLILISYLFSKGGANPGMQQQIRLQQQQQIMMQQQQMGMQMRVSWTWS